MQVTWVVKTPCHVLYITATVFIGGEDGALLIVCPKDPITEHRQIEGLHNVAFVSDQPEAAVHEAGLLDNLLWIFKIQVGRFDAVRVLVTPEHAILDFIDGDTGDSIFRFRVACDESSSVRVYTVDGAGGVIVEKYQTCGEKYTAIYNKEYKFLSKEQ